MHCTAQIRSSIFPPDGGKSALNPCVFVTGCNLSWKPQVLTPNAPNRNFWNAVSSLFNCCFLLFTAVFSPFLHAVFSLFPHKALWTLQFFSTQIPLKSPGAPLLLIAPSNSARSRGETSPGEELSSRQNFLHSPHQWDEMAQIINWPPGSFSSCQFLVSLQVLCWRKGWWHLLDISKVGWWTLVRNLWAKLCFPCLPSHLCELQKQHKHPHNPGIKRKENFILRKNSHHLYATYENEFYTENI